MDYEHPTIQDEIELESRARKEAQEYIKQTMQTSMANGEANTTKVGRGMVNFGFDSFVKAVAEFIKKEITPKRGVISSFNSIVVQTSQVYSLEAMTNLYTLATCTVITNAIFTQHNDLNKISQMIGQALEEEVRTETFLKDRPDQKNAVEQGILNRVGTYYKRYYVKNKVIPEAGYHWARWPIKAKTALGGKLLELFIFTCDLVELYDERDPVKIKATTKVIPTQRFVDIWNANETHMLDSVYKPIPMIVPPAKWTNLHDGGYYGAFKPFSTFMRIHKGKSIFHYNYLRKLRQTDLSNIMRAINAVQETPWHINKQVLDVCKEIVKRGGEIGGIPRMQPLPEIPRLAEPYTPEELKAHKKIMVNRIHAENHRKGKALRCLSMLRTAERYVPYHAIYFPCNMDFRGRVYPMSNFSFQGDDLTKGLLLFQDVPPCTDEKAEEWFRIAGCEFYGNDKISFADQLTWVSENEDNILSVAEDPLGDKRSFWAESDCPFEFLGWCFEFKKMVDYKAAHNDSVVGWECGVPVAFDGTCSGLQHFSAALRDEIGGSAVNLIPGDKPRDIYAIVADKVNVLLKDDALHGTPDEPAKNKRGEDIIKYGTQSLAQMWLAYGVNRKVTKRSVMTLAYGSKQYGFKGQILEDTLKPALESGKGSMFVASQGVLAAYLAKLIWKSVTKTVVKAAEAMKWLQEVAGIVCKCGHPVTWTTPMGLPLQQHYMLYDIEVFRMRFLNTIKRWYIPHERDEVAQRKQMQGIAPNFIHSMDASHLQLTLNMASDRGIKHFSMIHDSYATCPAQADLLFHTVREAFVKMYTEHDVLEEFREDMQKLVPSDVEIPEPPAKGKLNINDVLDSLYTFH